MIKHIVPVVLALFVVSSCTNDLYETLDKNNLDPEMSLPVVSSYTAENRIVISWMRDPGADSYRLFRDLNPTGSFALSVYDGPALVYEDGDVTDGIRYYYRLAKVKGLKEFESSPCVMGVGSAIVRDLYEPNDVKLHAKEFVNTVDANIYYWRDSAGNLLEDTDWYHVTVGPRQFMTIRITLISNLMNEDITFGREGQNSVGIISGNTIELRNENYVPATFNFVIAVDRNNYLDSPAATGGRLGFYQVKFIQINNV